MGEILLVQDAEGDFRLLCEGFRQFASDERLATTHSAEEALALLGTYLEDGRFSRVRLAVIGCGFDRGAERLLGWLKGEPKFQHLPVVLFLPNPTDEQVERAYQSRANCVLRKTDDLEDFFRKIERALNVWLTIAALPGPPPRPC